MSEQGRMGAELIAMTIEHSILNSLETSSAPLLENTRNWVKSVSLSVLSDLAESGVEFSIVSVGT